MAFPDPRSHRLRQIWLDPLFEADVAAHFSGKGKWKARLPELLATLGRARRLDDGRWMG